MIDLARVSTAIAAIEHGKVDAGMMADLDMAKTYTSELVNGR